MKGFGEENRWKKKMNNTPKNAVCIPLKKEVLMCYDELVT